MKPVLNWLKTLNKLNLTLVLMALAGFSFTFFFWYPGSLSPDSRDSWDQAMTGHFRNLHPPIMALVWRGLEIFSHGPTNMLCFHLILFWGALLIIAYELKKELGWFALGIPFVGVFPSIFGVEGVIWKDVGLGSSLLMATALLLVHARSPKKIVLLGVAFCLIYAANVRHNGIFACVPYAALFVFTPSARHQLRLPWAKKLFYVVLILFAMRAPISVFEKFVLKPEDMGLEQYLFFVDLTALSMSSNKDLISDDFKGKSYTLPEVSQTYLQDARCSDLITYGGFMKVRTEPSLKSKIFGDWLESIFRYPLAYLSHRARYFKGLLGYGLGSCRSYHFFWDTDLGLPSKSQLTMRNFVYPIFGALDGTLVFRLWFYLVITFLGLGFLFLLRAGPVKSTTAVLLSSGALYFLPYFFVSVCCDFRYGWWTVISAVLGALLLVAAGTKNLCLYIRGPR